MAWKHFLATGFASFFLAISPTSGQAAGLVSGQTVQSTYKSQSLFKIASVPMGGDMDAIRKRGYLRVLVVANKTHYMVDKGRQFGVAVDLIHGFEKRLNQKSSRGKAKQLHAVFIPVHRDEIFSRLRDNRGDIAIANLTDTPERRQWADFSAPFIDDASEILVRSPGAQAIASVEDLSGKVVYVRQSSSFYTHLQKINEALIAQGRLPIQIKAAAEHLESEDLLEMVNANLIQYTVVDQHIGEFWVKIFKRVVLHPEIKIASGKKIAWAVRKGAPELRSQVDQYLKDVQLGTLVGNVVFRRYLENTKWVKSLNSDRDNAQFNRTVAFFKTYCNKYRFDPLMLVAQGYQESRLKQSARSRAGAIGVMQLMPNTGRSMRVGDIRIEEANIHAGVKYMRKLNDQYFNDPKIDEMNRTFFSFAAYNAGPARISKLRRKAEKLGLNPNIWFDNVETVVAMEVGREPVQYVANISKYYIAYTLLAQNRKIQ